MIDQRDGKLIAEYDSMVTAHRPHSPVLLHCAKAFLVGGLICTLGQLLIFLFTTYLNLGKDAAGSWTSMTLVLLTAILTGVGIYDRIAAFGGSGAAVPITGFANSMVSPAMEFKSEGWVTGLGAKLFPIAGPVLVFGTTTSVIIGLIYALLRHFGVVI